MTPPLEGRHWSHLALVRLNAFGFGINGCVLAMDTVILPVLVLSLAPEELKNTYLTALTFSGLVVAAIVQPVVGHVSDRTNSPLGRRIPYMLWTCVFVSLGIVGIGFAPSYLLLVGVWLFVQANINVGYGPFNALLRDLVPEGQIGVASSMKILSDAAGGAVLIAVIGEIVGRETGPGGIDGTWLALAVLAGTLMITTTVTSLTVPIKEPAARTVRSGATVLSGLRGLGLGLHPQLSRFLLSRFLMIGGIAGFQTYGLFFLRDAVGLDNPAQALGRMVVVIGAALALSVYPAGWVSDRVGRKPVILTGAIGAAVSAIAILSADTAAQVLVIASLLGISTGILLSANWALANDLGTRGQEALHMGMVNLATVAGSAFARALGPGIDLLNRLEPQLSVAGFSMTLSGYSALLIGCGVLFVAGGLLLVPLKVAPGSPSTETEHQS